ncbi:hypothetical protein [Bartonella schoenbuchensis]|uniref:Membrane protein n=1 Tax=Bartonella schoenbuchensis m07a TaxID=1094496 RepID=N6VDF7_9HYPH|nr:hypothetical protein [Bartonella schoenbuchensis]ENN91825.1 putative membrane protein [Bartonella schoenbuchensis m07a]
MLATLNVIAVITWLLSLPVIVVGVVLICTKERRKKGLKILRLGALLFFGSLIVFIYLISGIEQDQISTAQIEQDQISTVQIENAKDNDGIGFWGWVLLVILTFFALSTLYNYRQYKREKHFEEQVSMLLSNISPSNFSEASEMFSELDAYEYDYRLMRNEKLLGIQEYVTFMSNKKTQLFGRLLVTNQAIIFESPEKNERITWTKIASANVTYQGCQINRRSGIAWDYEFNANPRFAAVVRTLVKYH